MRSLAVTETNLETQRSVVLEERRSRYENQPYGTMLMELFARAYKVQPYRWPVIGSRADIAAATLPQVRAFHEMYYRPENATLCLAGSFEPEEARTEIERYFAPLTNPAGEMYRPFAREPRQYAQVRDFIYDSVPLPGMVMGMHIPDLNHDDYLALSLLARILTSGRSSRLYHSLVYDRRIAQSVLSHAYDLELPGLFIVRAIAAPGHDPEILERAVRDALDDVIAHGVTDEEVARAVNRVEAGMLRGLSAVQSRANLLNSFHVLAGDARRINAQLDRIRAVSVEDIRRAAAVYLGERHSTVLYWLPWPKETAAS
jgi:predicted Zn-dependent peptidase